MKSTRLIFPNGKRTPLKQLDTVLRGKSYREARYLLIMDENSGQYCLPEVVAEVEALDNVEFVEVPVGEECKSIEVALQIWQTLLENEADRDTVLIALGGGAVCDLTGFVAAGFKRGVRHINIPTTLIAMADAAIGGKTAINHGGVKNAVGFVKMPDIVCVEPAFLTTLPADEVLSGTFEVVKTAAVGDEELYNALISGALSPTAVDTLTCVVNIKSAVVKADPNDHGIRHILNFGHTFGHAVEAYSQTAQKPVSHGVAVGIGMAMAMRLSVLKLGLGRVWYEGYRNFISQHVDLPQYTLRDAEQLLALMRNDKKNLGGEVRAVLLRWPGEAVIDIALSDAEIIDTILQYTTL